MAEPGGERNWILAVFLTACFVVLISLASTPTFGLRNLALDGGLLVAIGFFAWRFPGSRFFNISLANFLAVYACVFAFFVEANFQPPPPEWILAVGFVLPIAAFLGGALLHEKEIRHIVTSERTRGSGNIAYLLRWLVPLAVIGGATFIVPHSGFSVDVQDSVFLVAMTLISAAVLRVAPQVSLFLLDTGLLFEDFFKAIGAVLRPAFAFLTFYSMQVIVFAALYRIIDRFSSTPPFLVNGERAHLSFLDALYFSLINVSTVGFGDINPATHEVRLLTGLQVIVGVLLLIFGVAEITRYARERREHLHH